MPWQQYLPESSFLVVLHSIKWEQPSQQAVPTTHGSFPTAVQLVMGATDVHPANLDIGKTIQNLTTVNLVQVAQQITQLEVPKNHLARFAATMGLVLSAMMGNAYVMCFTRSVPIARFQHLPSSWLSL